MVSAGKGATDFYNRQENLSFIGHTFGFWPPYGCLRPSTDVPFSVIHLVWGGVLNSL